MSLPHNFHPLSDTSIERYLVGLRRRDIEEQAVGRYMLVREGEKAIPALLNEMRVGNGSKARAAETLGEIGSLTPMPELLDMLGDEHNSDNAFNALRRILSGCEGEKLGSFEHLLTEKRAELGKTEGKDVNTDVAVARISILMESVDKRRKMLAREGGALSAEGKAFQKGTGKLARKRLIR